MNTFRSDHLSLRCRALNKHSAKARGRDFVLVWLQQTLRGVDNPVIDAALLMGRRLRKPVLVYHGLGQQYPHASDRLHTFILQASVALEEDVLSRGMAFVRHVEEPTRCPRGLLYALAVRACAVFVDDIPAFVGRWQAQTFAAATETLVLAVDSNRLVPEQALPGRASTTPIFRKMVSEQREYWLTEPAGMESNGSPFTGELPISHCEISSSRALEEQVARCDIDHSLPPVGWCDGARTAALQQLAWAAEQVIPGYAGSRNDPSDDLSVTRLSPYLHFGVLGPREVALSVDPDYTDSRSRWKFLDELLTWREFWHHRAIQSALPSAYGSLPITARATLEAHADDPRPEIYSLEHLTHGATGDSTWNAAQKQFLIDGWMHNNLRMYWGKRLLAWLPTPQAAWTVACHLNDRLSLDGRDPATYGSLQWCFGASRPAREAPVYGTVPRKTDAALRRRCGDWLDAQAGRTGPRIEIPEAIDARLRPQASGRREAAAQKE